MSNDEKIVVNSENASINIWGDFFTFQLYVCYRDSRTWDIR